MAAAPVTVPGLERLSQLANILIHQTSRGYYGNNYTVLGGGEILFTMNEVVPDTFFRGGSHRPFIFDGVDTTGKKMFSFHRPPGSIFLPRKVELFVNEELISIVHMAKTFTPIFNIHDAQDNPTIRLKGSNTHIDYFELQTSTKTPIGGLQNKSREFGEGMLSLKDDYVISFPFDLAVQFKLAVIVACVFIDFQYNEGK